MVTVHAHPMQAVQRQYSIECTSRGIGFPLVDTVSSPKTTQWTQRSKFCWLNQFLVPHDRWICTKGYARARFVVFGPPKTGTRLLLIIQQTIAFWIKFNSKLYFGQKGTDRLPYQCSQYMTEEGQNPLIGGKWNQCQKMEAYLMFKKSILV